MMPVMGKEFEPVQIQSVNLYRSEGKRPYFEITAFIPKKTNDYPVSFATTVIDDITFESYPRNNRTVSHEVATKRSSQGSTYTFRREIYFDATLASLEIRARRSKNEEESLSIVFAWQIAKFRIPRS